MPKLFTSAWNVGFSLSPIASSRLQGSCSPTNYKNVGIFATTTSRASLQAIKFIFTIEKIGAFATKKAFAFPVFQFTSSSIFPKDVFLKSLLRLFRMGAIDCLFSKLKSILRLFRMGKLDCLFSKPLQVTYIVKATAPVQKSCKGNTVEAQLNNRSRGAMLKVLKRQHRDADCRHQGLCFPIPSYSFSQVSPSHDSKWGDCRRSRALLSHSKLICA
jgi:hypothetical protein